MPFPQQIGSHSGLLKAGSARFAVIAILHRGVDWCMHCDALCAFNCVAYMHHVSFLTSIIIVHIQVEAEIGSVPMVLIQNKIDLIDKAVITSEEAQALAEKVRARVYVWMHLWMHLCMCAFMCV